MREFIIVIVALFLTSCGGNGGNGDPTPTLSTGLKIFATASIHVGDFANDPLLQGANAISKADYFCNKDPNKPNKSMYKALIVDGINRDAVSNIDWVLVPNTMYYRSYGNIEIGQTVSTAIFPVLYANLSNSIADQLPGSSDPYVWVNNAWTGIGNPSNYAVGADCAGWTIGDNSSSAVYGTSYQTGVLSITAGGSSAGCLQELSLYCVEQP
jgi:hypothetical protein